MNQELFAFWKYDLFPYVLGAKILEMKEDGRVLAEGYSSYLFRPIKILPLEPGRTLFAQLKVLKQEYDTNLELLKIDYDKKLLAIFPEIKSNA